MNSERSHETSSVNSPGWDLINKEVNEHRKFKQGHSTFSARPSGFNQEPSDPGREVSTNREDAIYD
eukprot:15438569-Alexandrium_andersonii.AAC.1